MRRISALGRNRSSSMAADSDVPTDYAVTCGRVCIRGTGGASVGMGADFGGGKVCWHALQFGPLASSKRAADRMWRSKSRY